MHNIILNFLGFWLSFAKALNLSFGLGLCLPLEMYGIKREGIRTTMSTNTPNKKHRKAVYNRFPVHGSLFRLSVLIWLYATPTSSASSACSASISANSASLGSSASALVFRFALLLGLALASASLANCSAYTTTRRKIEGTNRSSTYWYPWWR